jgi:hypothetical protein
VSWPTQEEGAGRRALAASCYRVGRPDCSLSCLVGRGAWLGWATARLSLSVLDLASCTTMLLASKPMVLAPPGSATQLLRAASTRSLGPSHHASRQSRTAAHGSVWLAGHGTVAGPTCAQPGGRPPQAQAQLAPATSAKFLLPPRVDVGAPLTPPSLAPRSLHGCGGSTQRPGRLKPVRGGGGRAACALRPGVLCSAAVSVAGGAAGDGADNRGAGLGGGVGALPWLLSRAQALARPLSDPACNGEATAKLLPCKHKAVEQTNGLHDVDCQVSLEGCWSVTTKVVSAHKSGSHVKCSVVHRPTLPSAHTSFCHIGTRCAEMMLHTDWW